MSFRLYLVRHGKTAANEKKQYSGWWDLPLSKQGIKQIKAKAGLYPPCQRYYTSGLQRTIQTLRLLYGDTVEFEVISGLREMNLGSFDHKTYEDLKENPAYIQWILDKTGDVKCLGGESKNEFYTRVGMAFLSLTGKIMKEQLDTALCVTHGGVIVSIMERLFLSSNNFYDWQPETGGGYCLYHNGEIYDRYEKL